VCKAKIGQTGMEETWDYGRGQRNNDNNKSNGIVIIARVQMVQLINADSVPGGPKSSNKSNHLQPDKVYVIDM